MQRMRDSKASKVGKPFITPQFSTALFPLSAGGAEGGQGESQCSDATSEWHHISAACPTFSTDGPNISRSAHMINVFFPAPVGP